MSGCAKPFAILSFIVGLMDRKGEITYEIDATPKT